MKLYKKLLSYVPESLGKAYTAILFSVLSAFVLAYGYFLIYKFLYLVIVDAKLDTAGKYAVLIVLVLTASALLYLASLLLAHAVGFHLETALRKRGIEGLSRASFRFFDTHASGTVRKVIDDNAAQTHTIVAHMIPDNSKALIMPILVLLLGFFVSIRVGIVVLALTLISGGVLASMMVGSEFMKIYQEALDKLSAETVEYIRGISVIKIFGVSLESMKKLFTLINEYANYAYRYTKSCKIPYIFYQALFFGFPAILIIPVAFFMPQLGDPKLLALDLIMALFLSGLMFTAMMKIMYLSMYSFQGNYAVDTLEKLYAEMEAEKISFGQETEFKNHNIEFQNVSFSYGNKKVIENLSFKLDENRSYALVGESGSGKSTIAKLISGYYTLDEGRILIGGKGIETYSEEALMKEISFVFQDSKLFKKSIYENVALAKEGAKREEVMNACALAGVDKIYEKFEQKENTVIGSKGVYLSGGEKQRVAIARAILKDSPVVIMDEASAAIDPDNEYELQKAFKNLMKNKTVIMIAHRLSVIQGVDEILCMENGKIKERGNHAELFARNGDYYKLYCLYSEANEWRIVND